MTCSPTLPRVVYLGGKIEHRPGLSDEDLDEAYGSCLFTVFPSRRS
jgi:hypothetical protein